MKNANVIPYIVIAALLLWIGYEHMGAPSPIAIEEHADSIKVLKEEQRMSAVRIDSMKYRLKVKVEKDSLDSAAYETRILYWRAKAKQIKIQVDTLIIYPELDTLLAVYDSIQVVQTKRIADLHMEKESMRISYDNIIKEKDEIIKTGFEINSHMDATVAILNKDLARQKKYKIGGTIIGFGLGFLSGRGSKQ